MKRVFAAEIGAKAIVWYAAVTVACGRVRWLLWLSLFRMLLRTLFFRSIFSTLALSIFLVGLGVLVILLHGSILRLVLLVVLFLGVRRNSKGQEKR